MPVSKLIGLAAALALAGAAAFAQDGGGDPAAAPHGTVSQPPQRVVSINLCTDQLALMLAGDGQLISVSKLAQDPRSSSMAQAAQALPTNGSGAEEVFLLQPDLVLAGTFTAAATVQMLRDLGIRVEVFAPATSLADVPARTAQMGKALGREAEARVMIDRFNMELDQLRQPGPSRPRAALFYVNSYTMGDKTLAGDILNAAGFRNVAAEAGLPFGGTLALEQMVMLDPDVIIQGRDYPGQARAEDPLDHPALSRMRGKLAGQLTDRDWICGTPQTLNAVRAMRDLRIAIAGDAP